MQIENIHISRIKEYDKNPRKNDEAVEYVSKSIKEFGFKSPIIIDKNNVVVCGHTRLKAAKKLGIKTVPCIKADDLSEEQVRAYRLADNKTAELSKWDFYLLNEELADLSDIDFDMSSFGFYIPDDDYLKNIFDEHESEDEKSKHTHEQNEQNKGQDGEYEHGSENYEEQEEIAEEITHGCFSVTVTFESEDDLERFVEYCEAENFCYERCNNK